MKKNSFKKGEMLIETLVAMLIFMLMVTTSFSVYKSFSKASRREAAYIFFESECLGIDSYYDKLGINDWAQEFFGENFYEASEGIESKTTVGWCRYDASFNRVSLTDPMYKYDLTYKYENGGLTINVEDKEDGYKVIEDLEYGVSEADDTNDVAYFNNVIVKNIDIVQISPDGEMYYGHKDDDEDEEGQDSPTDVTPEDDEHQEETPEEGEQDPSTDVTPEETNE